MSTGLFNANKAEPEIKPQPEPHMESAPLAEDYRALSVPAVISLVTGLLSALLFVGLAFVLLPIAGIIVGVIALSKIKREPTYYTGRVLGVIGIIVSAVFLISGAGWHAYVYATEVPAGYTRISYDQLRDPNLPQMEFQPPPASAKGLDGEKVFIKGYMYPPTGKKAGDKVNEFVLCRDNGDCCFGGNPPVLERILVNIPDGKSVVYSDRVMKLAGTFKVLDEIPQSDKTVGYLFYTLEVDHVR